VGGTFADTVYFPTGLAVGEGGVWVFLLSGIIHIDEKTGDLLDPIQYPSTPGIYVLGNCCTQAFASGRFFFTYGGPPNLLTRLNPATGEYLRPFKVTSQQELSAAFGAGSLWVTEDDGVLARIDPNTGAIRKTIHVGGNLDAVAYGDGAVWVANTLAGTVTRIDPATNSVVKRLTGVTGNVSRLDAGQGAAWILDSGAGTVTPIDAATNTFLSPIRVGTRPTDMSVGLGAVWVSDKADNAIYRIEPDTHSVTKIDLGAPIQALAVDTRAGTLWAVVFTTNQ
jgi:streptogramin lyase